ncbi:hypothetical protein [Clostridium tyrobutyricum]|jgi:hypothetical protein|uniref:hypothetical protein n=1 Tax=Clostridium tyrobutyricum TaxID=1519 RepID=UPI0018AA73BA|nr:hypothetical protein [Clostridium tyrobutyricum]
MALSEEAKKARREYKRNYDRKYRETHRQQLRDYKNKWRSENKDKVKQYVERYWEKKGRQLRENSDPIWQFIKERCILQSELSTSNKELTQAFNNWNSSNLSTTKFALEFKDAAVELGLEKKRTKYGNVWQGVGLK